MQEYYANQRVPFTNGNCSDYNPMMMPEQQLEMMYPKIYYIVNPIIIRQCNYVDDMYGPDYIPSPNELERMIDRIMPDIESRIQLEMPDESKMYNNSDGNPHGNPHGNPNGNPFLRGLVGTLLIRELLGRRRRRRPFRRFSPYYPGFYPGYNPYFYPGFY